MKNKITYGILSVILFVTAYFLIIKLTDDSQYTSVPFEIISTGGYGGIKQKSNIVIKNEQELLDLWSEPSSELLEVDFETEMIIAIFMGEFGSGGYSTEVIALEEDVDTLKVTIENISPGSNCATTDALSQPFYVVKTKKTDKEIEFKEINKVHKC